MRLLHQVDALFRSLAEAGLPTDRLSEASVRPFHLLLPGQTLEEHVVECTGDAFCGASALFLPGISLPVALSTSPSHDAVLQALATALGLVGPLARAAEAQQKNERVRVENKSKLLAEARRRAAPPPFGFQRGPDGSLHPCEKERLVLDRIDALRMAGASIDTMTATLAAEGHRNRRGNALPRSSVALHVARLRSEQRAQEG